MAAPRLRWGCARRRSLTRAASALLSALLGPAAAAFELEHRPPTLAEIGRRIPIEVTVEERGASPSSPTSVALYARRPGEADFRRSVLAPRGRSQFAGAIPGELTNSLAVTYYLEVISGGRALSVGSAEQPIRVDLVEATDAGRLRSAVVLVVMAIATFAVVSTMTRRDRKRRDAEADAQFWREALLPLVLLRGEALSSALTRLSSEELRHPLQGMRRFPRGVIAAKLKALVTELGGANVAVTGSGDLAAGAVTDAGGGGAADALRRLVHDAAERADDADSRDRGVDDDGR